MVRKHLIFHIGMPKSGSTYLQNLIFPFLLNIDYQGKGGLLKLNSTEEQVDKVEMLVKSSEDNVILMSDESFCGNPTDASTYNRFEDLIKALSTSYLVTVLIVLRRQDRFINSLYRHHIQKGGHFELDKFFSLTPNKNQIVGRTVGEGTIVPMFCDYSRFLSYRTRQNSDSLIDLKIVPFELIEQNTSSFVREIASAVGATWEGKVPDTYINRGPSLVESKIRKLLNHSLHKRNRRGFSPGRFLYSALLRIARLVAKFYYPPLKPVSKNWDQEILSYYSEGNRQINSLCRNDLKQFGYF